MLFSKTIRKHFGFEGCDKIVVRFNIELFSISNSLELMLNDEL
jgi:hypothetical protein